MKLPKEGANELAKDGFNLIAIIVTLKGLNMSNLAVLLFLSINTGFWGMLLINCQEFFF